MAAPANITEMAPVDESQLPSPAYRSYILFISTLVALLSSFDKSILSMMITPIKKEFKLDDGQVGMIMGLAFAVAYTFCCIPIARIADRWSRRNVVALSVGFWSIMTSLGGLVTGFWQLFFARFGVGAGESGGSAPTQAMLSDNFPLRHRAKIFSIYLVGSSLGAASGRAYGGWAVDVMDWRWAFLVAGIPGLILAPIIYFTIPNSRAGLADGVKVQQEQRPFVTTMKKLFSIRTLPWMFAAAMVNSLLVMGLIDWVPQMLERAHGIPAKEIGLKIGGAMGIGSVLGHIAGGPLADWQAKRDIRWHLWTPIFTTLASAILAAIAYNGPAGWVYPIAGLQMFLGGLFAAPMIYMATTLAPVWARATAAAVIMFLINLVGLGLGPWLIGEISDMLVPFYGTGSLKMAMQFSLLLAIPVALCHFVASRHYRADLAAARQLLNEGAH